MSLHQYKIDFSSISNDEKETLIKLINTISFNGVIWEHDFKHAVFEIDGEFDISSLNFPVNCHLTRLT